MVLSCHVISKRLYCHKQAPLSFYFTTMASESTALRCAFCFLPPNCKSNAGKFKNLFGPTNSAGTEQMVLNWLLSSKGKAHSSGPLI